MTGTMTGVMTDLLLLAFWVLKVDGEEEWDTDHHKVLIATKKIGDNYQPLSVHSGHYNI